MKTILVPTDFSPCSVYALDFAALLAKKTGAKLHIINIVGNNNYFYSPIIEAPSSIMLLQGFIDNLQKVSEKHLRKLVKQKSLISLSTIVSAVSGTSIHHGIIDYSKKIKADLIIMGSNGSSGLEGLFIGSNAERTVRYANVPVVVVNHKIKNLNLKTIIFASDFTEEAYNIFPGVRDFAKIFNAKIYPVIVNTVQQFRGTIHNRELIQKFNKHFKGNYEAVVYDDYTKEEGIMNYSEEVNADLIVIGTHGKKGFARFIASDVSEEMVRLSNKPILVMNFGKPKNNK